MNGGIAPKRVFSARSMRKSDSSSSLGPYQPSSQSKYAPSPRGKRSSPRRTSAKREPIDPLRPYGSGDRPNSGSTKKFRVPSPYLRSPRSLSPSSKGSSSDEEQKGPQFAYGGRESSTPQKAELVRPFPSRYHLQRSDTQDEEQKDLEWVPFMAGADVVDADRLLQPKSFPVFPPLCPSLLSKYCTKPLFKELQNIDSDEDYSFARAIFPGVRFPDQPVGAFAGGIGSYRQYQALFDPIINDHHKTNCNAPLEEQTFAHIEACKEVDYVKSVRVPEKRWTYWDQGIVVSSRVEVVRNFEGLPTLAGLTYDSVQKLVAIQKSLLEGFPKGEVFSYS